MNDDSEILSKFIQEIRGEMDRLSYNQVVLNRSMIHLKNTLDFLQGARVEDIRKVLETYRHEHGQGKSDVGRIDESTESSSQEVSRQGLG